MNLSRLLFSLMVIVIAASCDPNDHELIRKGSLSLGIAPEDNNGSGRAQGTEYYAIVVSIEDTNGKAVETDLTLTLLQFGKGYMTNALQLTPGNYRITKFLVIDQANTVVLATPREGSSLAELVSDALPIEFAVTSENLTSVVPQVLHVNADQTPTDFGYVNFGFEIVDLPAKLIDLKVKFISPANGTPLDSAVISFSNDATVIRQKLDVRESNSVPGVMLATGIVTKLKPGNWNIKIALHTTLIPDKQAKVFEGIFDFTIKPTSRDLFSSGDSKLAILGDAVESPATTKLIQWEEYFDFFLPENLDARVRLPVNPLNPFFEVSIPNADWGYIFIDRTFYNTPPDQPSGGFVQGNVAFEDYRTEGSLTYDLIDSHSFKATTDAVSTTPWNTADCIFIVVTNDGNDTPLFYYSWDNRTSHGLKNRSDIPNAQQLKDRMLSIPRP